MRPTEGFRPISHAILKIRRDEKATPLAEPKAQRERAMVVLLHWTIALKLDETSISVLIFRGCDDCSLIPIGCRTLRVILAESTVFSAVGQAPRIIL